MKISAAIIAFNEADKIGDAIESVSWADEIIVIDSESTDSTREIADSLGARVILQPWLGFSGQKQLAVNSAENDWIFSLDADERVSESLKEEIFALGSETDHADGYRIPRLSFYLDRPIRHGGWYPDRQLRLFDRRKGKWNGRLIHESIEMNEESVVKNLTGDILHLSIDGPEHHHRMIGERYAPLAARQMFECGKRMSALRVMSAGWFAFTRSYVLQAGFLDGLPGYCVARFSAHHAFLKHLLLWEMQRGADDKK